MKEGLAVSMILLSIFLVGFIIGGIIRSPYDRDLITECQKSMARDQYCTLIAIPLQDKENELP